MDDFMTGIGNDTNDAAVNNAAMQANNVAAQAGDTAQQYTGYSSTSSYDSTSNYGGYSSTASYSDFDNQDSDFIVLLKGALGAVVGAIPGVILIIFLARIGFIAAVCGAIMAAGSFFGYKFMTKGKNSSESAGLIICGIVMLIGVYVAVRTSWCMEVSSLMQDKLDITPGSLNTAQSDILYEYYGVRDVSFSECSSNFWTMLDRVGVKGEFMRSLLENLLFAVVGGIGTFSKYGKSDF